MTSKRKTRILCGVTTLAVLAGTLLIPRTVKADWEMPSAEVLKNYQQHQDAIEEIYEKQAEAKVEYVEDKYWYYNRYYPWWNQPADVPYVKTNNITLDIGDTYSIPGYGVTYESTNPNVASVDSRGNITAHNDGYATIIVRLYSGKVYYFEHVNVRRRPDNKDNNNNNVVYYPVTTTPTANVAASWNTIAANLVAATAKGGTVTLSSAAPIYFDSNFINILSLRPDVAVNVTFGYNGHSFLLSIPKGYNLRSKANLAGCVDFLTLSNVTDGKIRCRLLY